MRRIVVLYTVPDNTCDECELWNDYLPNMKTCPYRGWVGSMLGHKPTKLCREAEVSK